MGYQGKKYLVIMTNGDAYNVSREDFENIAIAMVAKKAVVTITNTKDGSIITLLVQNISAAVERSVENA